MHQSRHGGKACLRSLTPLEIFSHKRPTSVGCFFLDIFLNKRNVSLGIASAVPFENKQKRGRKTHACVSRRFSRGKRKKGCGPESKTMQTDDMSLIEQTKALRKPTLEKVIFLTPNNKRPEQIQELVIQEAKAGNIAFAATILDLLWPSVLEKDEYTPLRLTLLKPKFYSFYLNSGDPEIVDKALHEYVDLLYFINFHLNEQKVFDLMEKVGTEMLQATHLVRDEKVAVSCIQSFLYQYVSESALTKVKADEVVRESFKRIAPGICPDVFFAERSLAYLRRVVQMLKDNSDPFVQTRIQADMLGRINRVLGIELVKRADMRELSRFFEIYKLLSASPDSALSVIRFLIPEVNSLAAQAEQIRQAAEDELRKVKPEAQASTQITYRDLELVMLAFRFGPTSVIVSLEERQNAEEAVLRAIRSVFRQDWQCRKVEILGKVHNLEPVPAAA
jgi:hypothetical protein